MSSSTADLERTAAPGHRRELAGPPALGPREVLLLVASLLVAVSGGVHMRLFREAYRDIHLDRILGIDLAGSFVLAVAAATATSVLLVAAVAFRRAEGVAAVAGIAYAVGSLAAYGLSRTVGILGFEEDRWIPEAVLAKPVELAAVVLLGLALLTSSRRTPERTSGPSTR